MATWLPVALSALTFASTFLGGWIALRSKGSMRFFFAFSAGTLLAISFVDLLPEAMDASDSDAQLRAWVFYIILASFVLFHLLERYVLVHHTHEHEEQDEHDHAHDHSHAQGGLGATGLVIHSLLDGVAIGAAFQASSEVGVVVALAVIAHDFADGVNTVTLTRRVSSDKRRGLFFLLADAIAPVVGAALTLVVDIPQAWLAIALAFFVGHFLYIGASDLIPEMHRGRRSWPAFAVHLAGMLVIVVLTRLIQL